MDIDMSNTAKSSRCSSRGCTVDGLPFLESKCIRVDSHGNQNQH